MSFGRNLQFLRRMRNGMTQEDLAERMGVSRQTISKWELDQAYPEMEKAVELCGCFSCTLDQLLREDMNVSDEAYSNIRLMEVKAFGYVPYAVVSGDPEGDANRHVQEWAASMGIEKPEVIGWDFPHVSQEQINVFHMHGYAAACILPQGRELACKAENLREQGRETYAVITIRQPFITPFARIPNAYKTLMAYMRVNQIKHKMSEGVLPCFEKVYENDGVTFMDVYIAADV